jgi:hypothetical protein
MRFWGYVSTLELTRAELRRAEKARAERDYSSSSARSYGSDSGSSSGSSSSMDRDYSMPSVAKPSGPAPNAWDANKPKSATAAKGMSLSKGKKSDAFFDALRQEEEAKGVHLPPAGLPAAAAAAGRAGPAAAAAAVVEEQRAQHVMVAVEEQVNVSLERDGGLRKMEVQHFFFFGLLGSAWPSASHAGIDVFRTVPVLLVY